MSKRRRVGRSIVCGIMTSASLAACGGTSSNGAAVTEPATVASAEPTTVPATTTSAPPTTTATTVVPVEPAGQLFVGWASGTIAAHDSQTGALEESVKSYEPEGLFMSLVGRTADGTSVFGIGIEDSWYECDTVIGMTDVVSPDGTVTHLMRTGSAELSGDGSKLAYVSFSECGQDPADTTPSMLPLIDTVVVRSLVTGEEKRWTFPAGGDNTVVESLMWYGASLLVVADGKLVTLDPEDPQVPSLDAAVLVSDITGGSSSITLLGARVDGTVIAQLPSAMDGQRPVDLIAFDPAPDGTMTELATVTSTSVSVDRTGTHWAAVSDGVVTVDGHVLQLEVPPLPPYLSPGFVDMPIDVTW